MSLATERFIFPFDTGEPVITEIPSFYIKDTYDKYYVLDVNDFLGRGEVLEVALKNTYFEKSKQSNSMMWKATKVDYDFTTYTIPPVFGTFLGKFIPFMSDSFVIETGSAINTSMTQAEISNIVQNNNNSFFEVFLSSWMLFLLGPHTHKSLSGFNVSKPVWIKFYSGPMTKLWEPRYKELLSKGLPNTPIYEQALNEIKRIQYTDVIEFKST